MVFVKNSTFFLYVFFSSKKSQKESFFDILDRKECFLDLKSEVLKSQKNRHFAKGLVHGFRQKIDLFVICFFFSKRKQKERVFYILDRKQCFLDLKGEVLAKSQKSRFCIGVSPWFLAKNRPFSYNFFFEQKARKKYFLIFWIENKVFWTFKVKFSLKIVLFLICFFLAKKNRKKHFLKFWIEKNAF